MKRIFLLLLVAMSLTGCHTHFIAEYTISPVPSGEKQKVNSHTNKVEKVLSEVVKEACNGLYLKKLDAVDTKDSIIVDYEGPGSADALTAIKKENKIIITLYERGWIKPLPQYSAAEKLLARKLYKYFKNEVTVQRFGPFYYTWELSFQTPLSKEIVDSD